MKKVVSLILTLTTLFVFSATVYAEETHTCSCESEHIEVIFEENSALSDSAKEAIIASICHTSTPNPVAPAGILCLFGHDYIAESVITITHRKYGVDPRCLKETFTVRECTRCGNTDVELDFSKRISCC